MSLTNEQLSKLKCEHCKKSFKTYPKKGQRNLPDEIPYIKNGIVILKENSCNKYYHGYVGVKNSCFEKAMIDEELKPDINDEDNWAIQINRGDNERVN